MTDWNERITGALVARYFDSACEEDRSYLRLRVSALFPGFDTAHPDEKESFLEAAESLERKGLAKLHWEKRGKGERLKTLTCENFEALFEETGRSYPKPEVAKIKAMLDAKAEDMIAGMEKTQTTENIIALLKSLSLSFSLREIGQGIDENAMAELVRFLDLSCRPDRLKKVTTRALSILLYSDSKRLENLISLCAPLLARSQKAMPFEYLVMPERSYPEALISGRLIFECEDSDVPMVNAGGVMLNIPLESATAFGRIRPFSEKSEKTVLTIENKETFFALGSPRNNGEGENVSRYDCFLYVGGYPNRAAAALIKILSASGFAFFHAGDLDPDGILILQNIGDIAQKPVSPVRMDADTFDKYRPWARTLGKPRLQQIRKIRGGTSAIPEIAGLLRRIGETGLGVEQEIIDYR